MAAWWQSAVLYQIYPRSFQDTSGDGIGDLPGILRRLDYVVELGVDAIWMSPIYPSPMKDFGYDISDYAGIDPLFGAMEDFDRLLAEAHRKKLKLILDFVPNHTSDQHPWFLESRSSRNNSKRDWYIWHDPGPGGGPPNNWISEFGGSAWEWDARTGQYYYHAFLPEQPDLNWRNREVREAMHQVMRFWLAKGIDGFRVDVIWHLIKDEQFRDNPPNPDYVDGMPPHHKLLPIHSADLPDVHEVIRGLRRVIDEYGERLLIGEIYLPLEKLVGYYGRDLQGAHLPFNFALLRAPWRADAIAGLVDQYEALLPKGGWPNWVLGNHDNPRIASRVGPEQARIAAMMLLTLRGTPTIYYGDEIAMPQVRIGPDEVRDPFEKRVPGIGVGRDGARTPMQWSAEKFAGFSEAAPWLPVAPDFRSQNVENERGDSSSIWNLYRRLIAARRSHPALTVGAYSRVLVKSDLFVYLRRHGDERILVALNFGGDAVSITSELATGTVLVSVFGDREGEKIKNGIDLRGHGGLVIRCT